MAVIRPLDWSEESLQGQALPSWMLSIFAHAVLFVLLLLTSTREGMPDGDYEGGGAEVGLHPRTGTESGVEAEDSVATEPTEPYAEPTESPLESTEPVPFTTTLPPSVKTQLPRREQVLGVGAASPGNPVPTQARPQPKGSTRFGGVTNPAGTGKGSNVAAGRPDGTKFFGLQAKGKRFVYAIDMSGSMLDNNAYLVARQELISSLERLDDQQQFQIIFYNLRPLSMELKPGQHQMFAATTTNRTIARQFIYSIQPDGGTNHLPALRQALSFNPDAIFLLTDAQEPRLSESDQLTIKKLNAGQAQIHTIEFGKGADLEQDNFLRRLAAGNGGSHRYRDVLKFDKGRKAELDE